MRRPRVSKISRSCRSRVAAGYGSIRGLGPGDEQCAAGTPSPRGVERIHGVGLQLSPSPTGSALPCAGCFPLESHLELGEDVERPRARPVMAASQKAVPHPIDGVRIEQLVLVAGRPPPPPPR